MRNAKREQAMLEAAGDEEGAKLAAQKVRQKQRRVKDLVDSNKGVLIREYNREWISGYKISSKRKQTVVNADKTSIMKLDLQFFSEKDVYKQKTSSLRKAIVSYTERIEDHRKKLDNPEAAIPDWGLFTERHKQGLKRHWEKEIQNFEESIQNRFDELRRRGELDE